MRNWEIPRPVNEHRDKRFNTFDHCKRAANRQ